MSAGTPLVCYDCGVSMKKPFVVPCSHAFGAVAQAIAERDERIAFLESEWKDSEKRLGEETQNAQGKTEEIARLNEIIRLGVSHESCVAKKQAAVAAEREWWLQRFDDDTPCVTAGLPTCEHEHWSQCVLAVATLRAAGPPIPTKKEPS